MRAHEVSSGSDSNGARAGNGVLAAEDGQFLAGEGLVGLGAIGLEEGDELAHLLGGAVVIFGSDYAGWACGEEERQNGDTGSNQRGVTSAPSKAERYL